MPAIYRNGTRYGNAPTSYPASNVAYDPTTSGLSATNAQDAIDELDSKVDSLPNPMVYRGTVGTGGTITTLPTDGSANIGDTYKVITEGTYAGQSAKVGDTFICLTKTSDANTWTLIPSGDEYDTTYALGVDGNNVTLTPSSGSVQSITVPYAEKSDGLEASVKTVGNKIPYNFRPTNGGYVSPIGDRETDMLVGGTVAFNQMVTDNASHIVTSQEYNWNNIGSFFSIINGHKYLATLRGTLVSGAIIRLRDSTESLVLSGGNSNEIIISAPKTTNGTTFCQGKWNEGTVDAYLNVIDLTQMFGSTIADYIYTLESGTAGAGVAWFKSLFPKPYYAYNAGELMSVKTSAHKMVGFNAWDEEWELGILDQHGEPQPSSTNLRSKNFTPVLPSTAYYFMYNNANSAKLYIAQYDANKKFISYLPSSAGITSPSIRTTASNCHYIKLNFGSGYGTTYKNDCCVNLSWDGERNGEYEPYIKHEYALGSGLELRGIPKLDSNNKLYYDGDTYESDGTVTRKYGVVDLGTLNWSRDTYGRFSASVAGITTKASGYDKDLICPKYIANMSPLSSMTIDKTIARYSDGKVYIMDSSYSTSADFKTAMSGVYLVYELATPTTETADAFKNPQICDSYGTEEYVDTRAVAIPVGHNTTYYFYNDKEKLDSLPDSANADGTYVIKQTEGKQELVTPTASSITYDNGTSGLSATNVKSAIDELATEKTEINDTTASASTTYSSNKIVSIIVPIQDNAGYHNSIYRGKYLGSEVTAAQWSAISAGTFDDLFIGDYWTIGSVNWRIAHFNYWLNCGDTNTTAPHVVIVPDTNLYSYVMNDTNITTGGYFNSKMRGGITETETFTGDGTTTEFTVTKTPSITTSVKINGTATSAYTLSGKVYTFTTAPAQDATIEIIYVNVDYLNQGGLAQAKTTIEAAFGSSHILSHRVLLTTATNSSGGSNWAWQTSSIDLMSEVMVYGIKVWANSGYEVGVEKEQLALFRLDHSRITNRSNWWLRSAHSVAYFANVNANGSAGTANASGSIGVRPAFAIF